MGLLQFFLYFQLYFSEWESSRELGRVHIKREDTEVISLPEFRKLLGPEAKNLPDKQIEGIRDIEYRIADAIFEQWLREKNSPQKEFEIINNKE